MMLDRRLGEFLPGGQPDPDVIVLHQCPAQEPGRDGHCHPDGRQDDTGDGADRGAVPAGHVDGDDRAEQSQGRHVQPGVGQTNRLARRTCPVPGRLGLFRQPGDAARDGTPISDREGNAGAPRSARRRGRPMRSRFVLQLASHVPVLILGTWQIVTWEARTAGQGTDQLLRRARWATRNPHPDAITDHMRPRLPWSANSVEPVIRTTRNEEK